MSRLIDTLLASIERSQRGITTGGLANPHRATWAQVHTQARAVAATLLADGLRPGGAVALLAIEPALIAPAVQGVWLAGGSVTMLHPPTLRGDIDEWTRDSLRVLEMIEAVTVLIDPSFEAVAPFLEKQDIAPERLTEIIGVQVPEDVCLPVYRGENYTAFLQLTSGSTGQPKAVCISDGNLFANLTGIAERGQLDVEHDILMSWLPLFHDMGMIAFLAMPMMLGMELVKITPLDFLSDPLIWPALIDQHRATITGGPNFAYTLLGRRLAKVKDAEAYELSSLRIALNGAEPIDEAGIRRFTEAGARFGLRADCVLAAYGMAEATVAVSAALPSSGLSLDTVDPDHPDAARLALPAAVGAPAKHHAKLGRPVDGCEVVVVDPDGTVLGERHIGEVLVRGEAVTEQYITADGPVAAQDGQGWLHTGDLGYLVDGEVVICGRSKDVIIMAGRNIYPTDIERAAESVDGVRAGCAAAIRLDGGSTREGFAVIVESWQATDTDAASEIAGQVMSRIVDLIDARPVTVKVVEPGKLPKTPSGKLRRTEAAIML